MLLISLCAVAPFALQRSQWCCLPHLPLKPFSNETADRHSGFTSLSLVSYLQFLCDTVSTDNSPQSSLGLRGRVGKKKLLSLFVMTRPTDDARAQSFQHRLKERTPKHFKKRASRQPERVRSAADLFRVSVSLLRRDSPDPLHGDLMEFSVRLCWSPSLATSAGLSHD